MLHDGEDWGHRRAFPQGSGECDGSGVVFVYGNRLEKRRTKVLYDLGSGYERILAPTAVNLLPGMAPTPERTLAKFKEREHIHPDTIAPLPQPHPRYPPRLYWGHLRITVELGGDIPST